MGSSNFRRCRRRSPWIIAGSRRCVFNNSRSRSRSMSRNRPEYRMRMHVNSETGEYDQEDVFAMITAAMGRCLLGNAASARAEGNANLAEGSDETIKDYIAEDEDQAADLEEKHPETITMTRDDLNKLATEIAEEIIRKRSGAPAPLKSRQPVKKRSRPITMWNCCNCYHSGMSLMSTGWCPNCAHQKCEYCQMYKMQGISEEEEEDEERVDQGEAE